MAKRLIDLLGALVGLALLGLPMLIVALAIRLDSPGPVLFRQTRVGRGGRPFAILKFRTMRHEAHAALPITVGNDPRITRIGQGLRGVRIDEWPQLWNVLRGDMSLVGPRPEVPRYVAHYPEALRAIVLSVRPGITDPAALAFRNEAALLSASPDPERCYLEDILPRKLALQASYAQRATVWTDLGVMLQTLQVLWARSTPSASGEEVRS